MIESFAAIVGRVLFTMGGISLALGLLWWWAIRQDQSSKLASAENASHFDWAAVVALFVMAGFCLFFGGVLVLLTWNVPV